MRIGGGILKPYNNPDEWLRLVKDLKYSAVLVPVSSDASAEEKKAYLDYSKKYDLLIGEIGIWKNSLSADEKERSEAIRFSQEQLAFGEEMGACCCVNISGSRGAIWDGCYEDNYSEDTYALIIDVVRQIIDSVNPRRTFYTLEPMPWMHPDSPDDYLKMIKDIDRKAFGVHLDYTNMISSIDKYLNKKRFIRECFHKLGPYIKSIHAKDVVLENGLPCRIKEVNPGEGTVDYADVLRLTEALGADMPLFVEHMNTYEEYFNAVSYLRNIASKERILIK